MQVCISVNWHITQPKQIQQTEASDAKDRQHDMFQTFATSAVIPLFLCKFKSEIVVREERKHVPLKRRNWQKTPKHQYN